MKTLKNQIIYQPLWASYVACLKAISDYYNQKQSTAMIYGACGHAFILNIHKELCPSGPTAFSDRPMAALFRNLGIGLYGTIFDKNDPEFDSKQREARQMTCKAIDEDMPTFGWELGIPEYSIIYGYEDENYMYYDCQGKPHTKKWDTLGKTDIGVISLFSAALDDKKADINKVLKDAFTFALEFSKHNKDWSYSQYANGTKAYDVWIDAMQSDKLNPFGLAYNAAVWAECRTMAVEFLREASKQLESHLLDNLIEHYDVVSWSLQKVAKLFPMPPISTDLDDEDIDTAIDNLYLAKEAEKAAFAEMKAVISQL